FDRLMQLAERNTDDIQRMAHVRKRFAGSIPGLDDSHQEREAREKRRKIELENRIRQREQEEKQRQQRAQAVLERRRRERIEAERAEEARARQRQQHQQQQQKRQQQQQQQQTKPAVSLRNSVGNRATDKQPAGRSSSGSVISRETKAAADIGAKPTSSTQSLSYDQLMQIASGKKTIPAKPMAERNAKPAVLQPPPISAGSSRSTALRDSLSTVSRRPVEHNSSPRRQTASARLPTETKRASAHARAAAPNRASASILMRNSISATALPGARAAKSSTSLDSKRDGPSRKPSSADTSSARPRERVGQTDARAPARPAAQEPPRVSRRPPEREIDRFG
ncbi:hypothetical protein J3B02_005510, partial [Coemansia erecta]